MCLLLTIFYENKYSDRKHVLEKSKKILFLRKVFQLKNFYYVLLERKKILLLNLIETKVLRIIFYIFSSNLILDNQTLPLFKLLKILISSPSRIFLENATKTIRLLNIQETRKTTSISSEALLPFVA